MAKRTRGGRRLVSVLSTLAAAAACGQDLPAADEEVMLFPTAGWFDAASGEWSVPIHGWIYEPERDSLMRGSLLRAFRRALELDEEETPIFRERAAWFIVDNERGKRIGVRALGRTAVCDPSGTEGHFRGLIRIPAGRDTHPAPDGPGAGAWIETEVVLAPDDPRRFVGEVLLLPPTGVSLISDIDDTIKVTGVGSRRTMLRNTFLEPFRPVEGMASVYRDLNARGVAFHYVSASPWPLAAPLRAMLREHGFPRGTLHLKVFRWKDERFFDLFAPADKMKPTTIEALLERYPERKFILIGDDGEQDPAIFADLAHRHPGRIMAVAIRRSGSRERPAALDELPAGIPRLVFSEAAELRDFAPLREMLASPAGEPGADERDSTRKEPGGG